MVGILKQFLHIESPDYQLWCRVYSGFGQHIYNGNNNPCGTYKSLLFSLYPFLFLVSPAKTNLVRKLSLVLSPSHVKVRSICEESATLELLRYNSDTELTTEFWRTFLIKIGWKNAQIFYYKIIRIKNRR